MYDLESTDPSAPGRSAIHTLITCSLDSQYFDVGNRHQASVEHLIQNRNQVAHLRFGVDNRYQDRLIVVPKEVRPVYFGALAISFQPLKDSRTGNRELPAFLHDRFIQRFSVVLIAF